jgi:cytochrome c oxidase assembly protein subunit 11
MLTMNPQRRRNLKVVAPCLVIGIMIGVVVYSPTLYRLFCAATGFGGTTQRIEAGSATVSDRTITVSDRTITVRFDSNVAPDLQWRFEPAQREVRVHLGEQKLVFFTAENLSNKAIVGHATFNVTPERPASISIKFNVFASMTSVSMRMRKLTCRWCSLSIRL